ncbi:MAG: apolipoprotein N-acyltransferase [Deltaproteobacteria bacterium]|jgi:apolipoprotein N-acyltransferase|nr:apolipoprotein N-acyltransferase [Deltaproteobacteria bacterium]
MSRLQSLVYPLLSLFRAADCPERREKGPRARFFPLPPLVSMALSALGGALQAFSFPSVGFYPLAFAALAPLLLALIRQRPKFAFFLGWLYGLTLGLIGFYWLLEVMSFHGGLGPWGGALILLILAAFLALYQALFALALAVATFSLRPGHPLQKATWLYAAYAATLWTGVEWLKNYVFTGFNWTPLAGALAANPSLLGLADVVGVYGLNFPLAFGAALWAAAIFHALQRPSPRASVGVAILFFVPFLAIYLLSLYGDAQFSRYETLAKDAPKRSLAVLQASVPQEYKWDSRFRDQILARYDSLAERAARDNPFLIVWSETAAPFTYARDPYETERIHALLDRVKIPMVIGLTALSFTDDDGYRLYNRAWLMYPSHAGFPDRQGPYYDKRRLVPFGEYIPMESYLPILKAAFLQGVMGAAGHFSSGPRRPPMEYLGLKLGNLICFESIFPFLARQNAASGADALLVTTNDAWFGLSDAPAQHFNHAVLRAVETRLPTVRAANNGISGLIYPSGRVVAKSELDAVGAYAYATPLVARDKNTLYVRFGFVLAPLAGIATVLALILALAARRLEPTLPFRPLESSDGARKRGRRRERGSRRRGSRAGRSPRRR